MGGGGFGGGPHAARAAAGLPFGGIPSELQAGVDRLLAEEPEHDDATVEFTQIPTTAERKPLSLGGLLTEYPVMLSLAGLSVLTVGLAQQAGPLLTGIAVDQGMVKHNFGVVVVVAIAYLVCTAIAAIGQRWQARVTGRLAAWVMNDLRLKVFIHLQRLSLDFFTEEKAGVIMSRMTSDIENLQQLLQDGLAQFALQGLTMVVITVILLVLDLKLALITVLLVVPITTILTMWFRRESEFGYDRVRDGIANVLADLSESLHGVRVVTAFNRARHNIVHHRNVVGDYRTANDYTAQINAVYGPTTQMIGVLGQAALLAIGGNMVLHGQMKIGTLISFFLFLSRFFQPIQLLVQQYNTFQQGRASIFKLRTLLSTEPSVKENPNAAELPPIEGEITFDEVSFGYARDLPVIHGVNLTIAPGETVAFVGPTGAGKSTLAKLVTRFYDPLEGTVRIDGHDLRTVTLASLRKQLGVVPQEPFLFAGTVRDNVAFARPESSDEVVWEAIRTVGLVDVVERLPDGIHTVVHERGQSLSSGERQLIALARAFVARPRVLVLDEATSNLDLLSETKIEAALDTLLQDRTAVLIAHRLSTAIRADRIVVVDEGRIAEVGTPSELIGGGGTLRRDVRDVGEPVDLIGQSWLPGWGELPGSLWASSSELPRRDHQLRTCSIRRSAAAWSSCRPSSAEAPVGSPSTPLADTARTPCRRSSGSSSRTGSVRPGADSAKSTAPGSSANSIDVSVRPAWASDPGTPTSATSTRSPS
jgi:ATP-binding cassette subfamily B protein